MILNPGQMLGPFEILDALGQGGMGTVYRAKDTRLGREVAIKVLLDDFSGNPQLISRFNLEARAVSALNHPGIMALFDVGQHEGQPYLVCELLEGQSLKERLAKGALSPTESIRIAIQVARGLSAAHAKGIVHRDLKPGNIFLTKEGAKILDFGLARTAPLGNSGEQTAATQPLRTETGIIMGTVAYMSPEQVRSKPADARSDLFALGVVLYEMLTGLRPFQGESTAETMAAILQQEPPEPFLADNAFTTGIHRILRHLLEKDPDLRFQNAQDLAFDLENLSQMSGTEKLKRSTRPLPRWPQSNDTWKILGILMGMAMLGFLFWFFLPKTQTSIPIYQQVSFSGRPVLAARFLPDGKGLVYSTLNESGQRQLWVSREEGPKRIDLPDTRLLAVSRNGELALLLENRDQRNLSNPEGRLLRASLGGTFKEELDRAVSADFMPGGSELCVITTALNQERKEYRVEWPLGQIRYRTPRQIWDLKLSREGRQAVFCSLGEDGKRSLMLLDQNGQTRELLSGLAMLHHPQWTPDGQHVLFFGGSSFLEHTLRWTNLRGRMKALFSSPLPPVVLDVNEAGELLMIQSKIRQYTRFGLENEERGVEWLDQCVIYGLSSNGKRLLTLDRNLVPHSRGDATYLQASDGASPVKLANIWPYCLSEDGTMAAVESQENPNHGIQLIPTGSGRPRTLVTSVKLHSVPAFSPNGDALVVRGSQGQEASRLHWQPHQGGPARPITPEGVKHFFAISPDGERIAALGPDGQPRIYRGPEDPGQIIPGLLTGERILQWDAQGEHLYVAEQGFLPLHVFRLSLKTGQRVPLLKLAAPEGAGHELQHCFISRDGRARAYSYSGMVLSELYRVRNWR